ncbi:hypothetical protein B0H13DRAFT_1901343 [Mycena leptocephala]|nr:hypothetical protein B0H13DRAFT_1901343 [Mycena leptocephala]
MVIGCAASLSTPEYFDVANCLAKRIQEREAPEKNGTPGIKAFHLKRHDEALGAAIQVDVDNDALPHSEPAWIGKRNAQDDRTFEDGMGGRTSISRSFLRQRSDGAGELQNNKANTQVTDELLADESFQHLICFANVIFRIFTHVFELTTTKEEKSERAEEAKTQWQEGVAMYSTVDSLQS